MKRESPSEVFSEIVQSERRILEGRINAWQHAFNLCESPPEQNFLVTFINAFGPHEDYSSLGEQCLTAQWERDYSTVYLSLIPQRTIQADDRRFRIDFVLEVRLFNDYSNTIILTLAIEIDGHDFHEKTKEQASRDKARDRSITRAGYQVLRFTGSDLYQGGYLVLAEIQDTIAEIARWPTVA